MIEDKKRWNERHVKKPMKHTVSPIVKNYVKYAHIGKALDLACGTGRNTHFLEKMGFSIDAVDLSDYALSCIDNSSNIIKIEVDLDEYNLNQNTYDLIVNTNYLNRRLMDQIKGALVKDGLLIFETFIIAHEKPEAGSMNPDFLLKKNELLNKFCDMDVIYYEEKDDINKMGEKVKIASLVAKKKSK
jgi:SAM-dependent methyltransferase